MCSENKGADQHCSYCEADLRLCFGISKNPVRYFAFAKTKAQVSCAVTEFQASSLLL